jgi:hypothetical protein
MIYYSELSFSFSFHLPDISALIIVPIIKIILVIVIVVPNYNDQLTVHQLF